MAKILLLEPENRIREMYEEIIESAGFDITSCRSPKECLKTTLQVIPQALVTSANKLETTWLIERVRKEKDPSISTIPILVISGDESEDTSEYIEIGATRCLPKFPESGEKLIVALRKIINIPRVGFN